ncbi:MAG: hypothetical protein AUI17_06060 [Acidobacteriales bacterium 13_2_20CM_2_55_5]|nr:MAG: hypothetical protein AUI17_06060 [Acidobacteriales bacterium 13_2_20CM_2_55_5]OLD15780.1 MAG: hypothetical protein AUI85_10865 [Acidobacteriales bacterium 13_1_40CM_3_55_5]
MNKLSTTVAFLEHELSEIRLILERKTGVLIQTPTEQLSEIVAEHLDARPPFRHQSARPVAVL